MADLPLTRVRSTGTVNAIYRLGHDWSVRLPRVAGWANGLTREVEWLPRLAPHLPLPAPEPVVVGQPTEAYPLPWAVFRWIRGRPYAAGLVDEVAAAVALAEWVGALRAVPVLEGAPAGGRRPLAELDEPTRSALERSAGLVDAPAATWAWDRALEAPVFSGAAPVWLHGDLLPPNLLVDDDRLAAVIDFGGVGVGDPAADIVAAWAVFDEPGRAAYREALEIDDGTWERGRGFALTQAALIVPYYAQTNPAFTAMARLTIDRIVREGVA